MNDKDIIKAMECCINQTRCSNCQLDVCPILTDSQKAILDLIKRQQAEIERLQSRNKFLEIEYQNQGNLFWARVETARVEAIKEFWERLTNRVDSIQVDSFHSAYVVREKDANAVMEEMLGKEDEGK